MRKRIGSLLLSLALCLTLLPTAAFAEKAQPEEPLPGEQLEQVQPVQEEPEENEEPSRQDEDVIAVQEMINALPDASELDEMDVEAQESACLAASEAYDAYDALTEGQQSALTDVDNMIAILEWATRQIELLANEDLSDHTTHGEGWTAWDSSASASYQTTLPNKAGKYYLTDNVTLSDTWKPDNGVVLCLNGKTITGADGQEAIQVNRGVTFTLTDCHTGNEVGQITHKIDASGCGVYVQYGTFNMYGGSITGNTVGGSGGGVCATNSSTFNMYGGSITGNSAKSQGGGVYAASTFNMYGGTISDNSAKSQGGGVFVSTQYFTVSGNAKITDNTNNGASEKNNVYLDYSGTSIQIGTEGLQSGAKIGVTTYATPSNSAPVTIVSSDAKAGYEEYFTSDKEGCYPVYQGGKIVLYAGAPHQHPICGETCTHTGSDVHTDVTWTLLTSENGEPSVGSTALKEGLFNETKGYVLPVGHYYLSDTLNLNRPLLIQAGVYLCLNGQTLTVQSSNSAVIIDMNGDLTLCDCSKDQTGTITHATNVSGRGVYMGTTGSANNYNGRFTMYGGSITGNSLKTGSGAGVYMEGKGTFNMHGGSITGNTAEGESANGSGVHVTGGTFNMTGGSITGNGGGVRVNGSGTFNMSGDAVISNNNAYRGGGVYVYAATFNMSGSASVSGNTANYGGGVYVYANTANTAATFNMSGNASVSGNSAKYGGGVYMNDYSRFTMSSNAAITGNSAKTAGGGVYATDGTFTMGSGTITGNNVLGSDDSRYSSGGGVYVNTATFNMTGGSITGNNIANSTGSVEGGGGVYVAQSATMNVSGNVQIKDNWKNSTKNGDVYEQGENGSANNLCLYSYEKVQKTVTINGELTGAKIGVTTCLTPTAEKPIQIATGANNPKLNYTTIFTPDAKSYVVTKDGSDNLFLSSHQHSWKYEASGATITAKCTAEDCSLKDCIGGTLTLDPPTDLTYDGTEKRPNIQSDKAWQDNIGATAGVYTYNRNDAAVERVIDAGTYKVEYYVKGGENAVAEVTYTIAKATPTINWQSYPYNKNFTGSEIANPQKTDIKIHDGKNNDLDLFTEIAFKWYEATKNGGNYTKANETPLTANPIDAGDYIIEATIAATNNTESATITKGLTVNKATDLGGYDKTVPVAVDMYPSSAEKVYTVDLDKILAEKEIRSGGSLALYAAAGIQTQSNWVNSAVLEGTTVKITMKALPSTNTGLTATVNVNLTSRNYKVIPVVITLTLQKKPTVNDITVSMDGWIYGEEAKKPTYTVPTGAEVKATYAAKGTNDFSTTVPTNAGEYTVKVQYETDTEIHTGTANFTISPKNLQQEMLDQIAGDRYYNGTEQTPDVTVTDGEKTLGKDVDYTVSYSNNINASTPTSQAVATVTGKGNYKGIISTTFVINPVKLSIIGEDKMTATASYGTRVKDIPVSSAKVYYNSGKVTIVSGTWKFDGDGMDDIPEVGNTKEYKAVFTPTSGSENYRECFTYITPSISQAAGSVTAPAVKTGLVYNGKEQALLGTLPASSTGTVQYSLDGTNYTGTPPTGKEAGTYTVSYKVVGDKNHLDVAAQSIQVKIEKLDITVTAENKTSRVGQALAELTYTYTPELAAGDAFTGTLGTNANPDAAGSYSITQGDLALNENYTIDFRAGTYTVADKQAQSDFRFESIPSAVSKTYGDPDFSAAAVGAVKGSTVTYESSEPAVATVDSATGKVTIKGAGTAVITAKASATEDYDEAAVTCTLTVGKKSIAIPAADTTVFTYNGKPQTYALVENEAYTVSGNVQTDAGSQNVTVQLKDKNNTIWEDGTDENKTYVFTIAPKPLSKAMIGDFPDQTYTGLSIQPTIAPMDGNKALTEGTDYTVSSATSATNVGSYTVHISGTGNYTGTVSKEWKITPAVLTISGVTVLDKTYNGSADATITAVAFNGLKNGEELVIGTDYEVIGAAFNDENVDAANKVTGTVALKNTGKVKNYTLSSATFEQTAAIGRADYNGTASTTVNIVKGRSTAQTGTLTAADFFPEGQMPAGAKITDWSLLNPTAIISSVDVDDGKLTYLSKKNIATASEESGRVTIATTNYKDITATLTFHPTDKLVQDGFKFENGSVTKTYGDEDFILAATGEVKGSTVTYESSEPTVATVDGTGKVHIVGAGTATITAKASATEDYDEAAATCTLAVEKKPIAIPAADATVFTYNGKPQTYALAENEAYTVSGNVQTDANETGYSVKAVLKDTANTQWADGMTADKIYTFVIGKVVITVTAKDQTAYVGDKAPALGADSCIVSGLVGEEKLTTQPTVKYVDADGKESAPDMTKTGETIIRASDADAGSNYTIRYEDGKLTVSTRPSGGSSSNNSSYTVSVDKTENGTITVSPKSASKGDTVTVTVKPDKGYKLDTLKVLDKNGDTVKLTEKNGKYTFTMPAGKVTVKGSFVEEDPEQIFADVPVDAYYYEAVKWAVEKDITGGIGNGLFAPKLNCTRAQIVTFLWRAAGSPEPKSANSFADVSADSYYAKAVAWAVENGITGGTGNGKFSPNATCTREQAVAFLYRASSSPAVSGGSAFSDVAASAYYADAVAWAEQNGVTGGIGNGKFGTGSDCTRAQIVTFLYRAYQGK